MRAQGTVFIVLFALALAAAAALVFLLGPGSRPETPAVVLAAPPAAESAGGLPSGVGFDGRALHIGADSVQTVVSTLSRAEAYSRTLTAVSLWNGGSATAEISVWVRDGNTRIDVHEGEITKHVLARGDEKWIWYSDRPGVWSGPAAADDADAYQTLLTYEDLVSLDRSAILDAGYETFGGETCISVRYIEGAMGYVSLCRISAVTGLLMSVETYDGGALVYTLSSSAPVLRAPDEELFDAPRI